MYYFDTLFNRFYFSCGSLFLNFVFSIKSIFIFNMNKCITSYHKFLRDFFFNAALLLRSFFSYFFPSVFHYQLLPLLTKIKIIV